MFLSREKGFYKDKKTGNILEKWDNPFTQKTNKVSHLFGKSHKQKFLLKNEEGLFSMPYTELDDSICWHIKLFNSSLEQTAYSQNNIYSSEFVQLFTKKSYLEKAELYSVPCQISWTQIRPYPSWMQMENKQGYLLYQSCGKKLKKGILDLPKSILDFVHAHHPEFLSYSI